MMEPWIWSHLVWLHVRIVESTRGGGGARVTRLKVLDQSVEYHQIGRTTSKHYSAILLAEFNALLYSITYCQQKHSATTSAVILETVTGSLESYSDKLEAGPRSRSPLPHPSRRGTVISAHSNLACPRVSPKRRPGTRRASQRSRSSPEDVTCVGNVSGSEVVDLCRLPVG